MKVFTYDKNRRYSGLRLAYSNVTQSCSFVCLLREPHKHTKHAVRVNTLSMFQ